MKKLICIALSIALVFTLAICASATMEYTYIDTIYANFSINRTWGIADFVARVESIDDVDLEVEAALQMYVNDRWETLYLWSTREQYVAGVDGSYAIARGYQYRLEVTGYAYDENGNLAESDTIYDYENFY